MFKFGRDESNEAKMSALNFFPNLLYSHFSHQSLYIEVCIFPHKDKHHSPQIPRSPIRPELELVRKAINYDNSRAEADISRFQQETSLIFTDAMAGRPIHHEGYSIAGPDGNALTLSQFRPAASQNSLASRPCIYQTHGGGLAGGNRFLGMHEILTWALQLDSGRCERRVPPAA